MGEKPHSKTTGQGTGGLRPSRGGTLALLLVDGHSSHQSPEVHQFCSDHNIILYRFPPHATHILQPCDVSFFKCLKAKWYLAERAFRIDHPGFFVTKTGFAGAFRPAWEKTVKKPGVVANGFRAAGLYPFTRQYIKEHVMPSSIYRITSSITPSTTLKVMMESSSTCVAVASVSSTH